jgi:hypothetical protein
LESDRNDNAETETAAAEVCGVVALAVVCVGGGDEDDLHEQQRSEDRTVKGEIIRSLPLAVTA